MGFGEAIGATAANAVVEEVEEEAVAEEMDDDEFGDEDLQGRE